MPDELQVHEVPDWGAFAGQIAWKHRNELPGLLARLYRWFWPRSQSPQARVDEGTDKPERPILIIGSGGSGKTTLAHILAGNYGFQTSLAHILAGSYDFQTRGPAQYAESLDTQLFSLKSGDEVGVVVLPGNDWRREKYGEWDQYLEELAHGGYRGVIFVASYGYHSLLLPRKEMQLSADHPRKEAFIDAYLNDRRSNEISAIRAVATAIQKNTSKLWMMTLVTKEDLWCRERRDVEAFYRTGLFGKEVDQIGRRDGFRHDYAFASLVIQNFTFSDGEMFRPNTEGYDHQRQGDSLYGMVQVFDTLRRWEEGVL